MQPTLGLPSDWSKLLQLTGLFALSGGVTNWLAVHMLFEKIPFIYGSGVIPSRFEDFKLGIKELIVNEFFTREQIDRFPLLNPVEVESKILLKRLILIEYF